MNDDGFRCGLGLYVFADRALIPTIKQVESGQYIDGEPCAVVDYRDEKALLGALKRAFELGNPTIPDSTLDESRKRPIIQRVAGAKSWVDLERHSIYFSIECWDSEFVVTSEGRASDGSWNREGSYLLEMHIPVAEGIEAVTKSVLDHLKTRKDLPGQAFGEQQKTARGA